MPDRVIRDELLQSSRWLDLPTDSHRLIYENLLLLADDYGNFEGGPRRLFRWMHTFTQIKTETDAIKVMSDLQDSDMVLRYEADGKEYWHLTRFKNSRKYWARRFPTSPYPESDRIPTKQEDAKNPIPQLHPRTPGGVGVGVGELPSRTRKQRASGPKFNGDTPEAKTARRSTWEAYSTAYFNRWGSEPQRNSRSNSMIANFCRLVPQEEAAAIAAFYVTNNNSWYVNKMHPVTILVADAEKLRTEWATGQQVTQTAARKLDQGQAQGSIWAKLQAEGKP